MIDFIRKRRRRLAALRANKYFLKFYYGEGLRDYPRGAAVRLLLSRLAFVSHVPLLLPDRHFLMRYGGAKMYINPFALPVTMDVALGVYEYRVKELFSRLVREGMTVLDIGAHKGSYSILSAQLMRDRGTIHAFEPDPANCEWICRNIRANGFRSIQLHQCALSDTEGTATFWAADGLGSLIPNPLLDRFKVESRKVVVATRKLDSVVAENNIGHIDLMKLDVEGADLMVLGGARETLSTNTASLLMDVDISSNLDRAALFDLLTSCHFKIYRMGKHLELISRADQLFLFDEHGRPLRDRSIRPVRDIYATKLD